MRNVLFAIVLFAASCACAANPVVQSASAAEAAGSRVDPEGTFTLPGSKGRLSALLKLPDDMRPGDRCPIAVLCHGFGADKCAQGGMFCDFAVALARVGVASVRFDFNGHGESEGALRDMTVLNEIEDAKRVVEWAASRPWCNGKVSLLGHSQGGVVAAMAAGELGAEKIARVVLLAPACVLKDDVRRGCTFGSRYDPKNPPEFVRLPGGKEIGRAFIQTSYDLPIFETARKFTGPVALIHGTGDPIARTEHVLRLDREYADSELHLMAGDDHGLSRTFREVCGIVAEFLSRDAPCRQKNGRLSSGKAHLKKEGSDFFLNLPPCAKGAIFGIIYPQFANLRKKEHGKA